MDKSIEIIKSKLAELTVKEQIDYVADLLCQEFHTNDDFKYIKSVLTNLLLSNDVYVD